MRGEATFFRTDGTNVPVPDPFSRNSVAWPHYAAGFSLSNSRIFPCFGSFGASSPIRPRSFFLRPKELSARLWKRRGPRCNLQKRGRRGAQSGGVARGQIIRSVGRLILSANLGPRTSAVTRYRATQPTQNQGMSGRPPVRRFSGIACKSLTFGENGTASFLLHRGAYCGAQKGATAKAVGNCQRDRRQPSTLSLTGHCRFLLGPFSHRSPFWQYPSLPSHQLEAACLQSSQRSAVVW